MARICCELFYTSAHFICDSILYTNALYCVTLYYVFYSDAMFVVVTVKVLANLIDAVKKKKGFYGRYKNSKYSCEVSHG